MAELDRRIVVLNSGSSSLKFAVYPERVEAPPILAGAVEGIGGQAQLTLKQAGGDAAPRPIAAADASQALGALADLSDGPFAGTLAAFGHRIVHGGPDLDHAVVVDDPTLRQIE